jgi:gliding motility-associated-like protein
MYIDHSVLSDVNREKENIIHIYRKSDGKFMETVTVYGYVFPVTHLTYTNPKCAEKFDIHTFTQHYEREVKLNLDNYADPGGYIAVFDRCCRGDVVMSLTKSGDEAISVSMEFPSLKKYPNYTSPEFTIPNGEYACINEPFQISFDVDRKSNQNTLKYKLVDAIGGYSKNGAIVVANPPAIMKVQPALDWASGYSAANPIPNSKPLNIDQKTGLVTITPTKKGVYIFAVMVEEFEGSTKIGHIVRDYSLVVIDCPINKPPKPIINYQGSVTTEITLCPGTNAILETQDDPSWNFRWQNNTDNVPNEFTSKIAVKDTGTYKVIKTLKTDCSDESVSETVKVKLSAGATLIKIKSNQTKGCDGDKIKLELQDASQMADWYLGVTFIKKDKSIDADKSGDYIAKTANGSSTCSSSQDNILVKILPKPTVTTPSPPYEICTGDKIDLETQSASDYIYQWYKNNSVIVGATAPKFQASEIGNYTVKVGYGDILCESISSIFKVAYKTSCNTSNPTNPTNPTPNTDPSKLIIPNAFSPDNDGLNDFWTIKSLVNFEDCEVSVYNTWGELIYFSKGYESPWDGTYKGSKVPSGTYLYKIDTKKDTRIYSGYLTIIY